MSIKTSMLRFVTLIIACSTYVHISFNKPLFSVCFIQEQQKKKKQVHFVLWVIIASLICGIVVKCCCSLFTAKPGLPTNVRISSCVSGMAEITWSAARDNNDPISAYVVYYNSSHDDVRRQGARPLSAQSLLLRFTAIISWPTFVACLSTLHLDTCLTFFAVWLTCRLVVVYGRRPPTNLMCARRVS